MKNDGMATLPVPSSGGGSAPGGPGGPEVFTTVTVTSYCLPPASGCSEIRYPGGLQGVTPPVAVCSPAQPIIEYLSISWVATRAVWAYRSPREALVAPR